MHWIINNYCIDVCCGKFYLVEVYEREILSSTDMHRPYNCICI